jgi:AcrR family transcriptional regulator
MTVTAMMARMERKRPMTHSPASGEGDSLWDEIAHIKRERILREAVDLFDKKGYVPTTVDAIAERLGATKPFVYYHFKNKIDLLVEICERQMREALAVTVKAVSAPLPARQRLELFVREFTLVVLNNHQHVAIYFREQLNLPEESTKKIAAMRKDIDRRLRGLLAEGKEAGEFEFDNLAIASLIVAGMVSYAFAWYRESIRLTKEEICEQMVKHVLRTVGA